MEFLRPYFQLRTHHLLSLHVGQMNSLILGAVVDIGVYDFTPDLGLRFIHMSLFLWILILQALKFLETLIWQTLRTELVEIALQMRAILVITGLLIQLMLNRLMK